MEVEMSGTGSFQLPQYDDLPVNADGHRTAWGLFGTDDSVGLFNLLTEDTVRAAVSLARRGSVFPLDAPLTFFDPPLFGRSAIHHVPQIAPNGRSLNEVLHDFNPQSSSQWDALAHAGYGAGQFYNGASLDDILVGKRNTIGHWARKGIVARGVLLDLARTAAEAGRSYDPASSYAFTVEDIEAARKAASIEFRPGDILVLRTGFVERYGSLPADERTRIADRTVMTACGIEHSETMARFLWNTHACAVACDCPSLEVWPMDHRPESVPFGSLHQTILGLFGMAIGELWWLEDLAADCARDGLFEFLLTSAPLNFDGFGSPPNALAIK
jgi:kynurenine formamidase